MPSTESGAGETALRSEFRAWLRRNLPDRPERTRWKSLDPEIWWPSHLRWHKKLCPEGWLWLSWPKEHGGRSAGEISQSVIYEELAAVSAPFGVNAWTLQVIGPTLLAHGTAEQKKRFLPDMLSAEKLWCLGISERNTGGSNASAADTTAAPEGDDFRIDGGKIWTTGAHRADYCLLLARSDPNAPKEMGISFFIVDLRAAGARVEPIRQLTGASEFNQMTFNGVRVPAANLVGKLHGGWSVLMTAFGFERFLLEDAPSKMRDLESLAGLIRSARRGGRPAAEDPLIRQKFAQAAIEVEMLRRTVRRGFLFPGGRGPRNPMNSLIKLFSSEIAQAISSLALEVNGGKALLGADSPSGFPRDAWLFKYLDDRSKTIARGTSEIHKNLIAWSTLDLPR